MRRRHRVFFTAFFISGIVFLSIFVLSYGEKQEVKNLVITYNNVLQKAYLELNPNLMEKFTSERELKKIDNYIAYLYKNGKILKGKLKDIKFKDIKVEKDRATVIAIERWEYLYIDPIARQPISELYDVTYGSTYYLKKIRGHWVVDELQSREIGGKAG
jgi:hypothetical protein